jgi:hypothetical protein
LTAVRASHALANALQQGQLPPERGILRLKSALGPAPDAGPFFESRSAHHQAALTARTQLGRIYWLEKVYASFGLPSEAFNLPIKGGFVC